MSFARAATTTNGSANDEVSIHRSLSVRRVFVLTEEAYLRLGDPTETRKAFEDAAMIELAKVAYSGESQALGFFGCTVNTRISSSHRS
jgi:hypothetical protein